MIALMVNPTSSCGRYRFTRGSNYKVRCGEQRFNSLHALCRFYSFGITRDVYRNPGYYYAEIARFPESRKVSGHDYGDSEVGGNVPVVRGLADLNDSLVGSLTLSRRD